MDWVKLIIPLIAVAVWIISNLANQEKEARRLPRAPTVPPPRPRDPLDSLGAGPVGKPEEENRYREEMDRKRERKPSAPKSIPKQRPRRGDNAPKLPPVDLRPAPLPPYSARKPGKEQRPPTPADVPAAIPLPVAPETNVRVGEPARLVVRPTPIAIKNVRELLKKPESLATAFLLREVLDLPLAKRARRRV
jgi:hypothetical protein